MRKSTRNLISAFCVLLSTACLCFADSNPQSPPVDPVSLGKPLIRLFAGEDDLPQISVETITFDRKGYLWVGTQNGAACYNGRRWSTVNLPNTNASNFVNALFAASDGSIWFAVSGGGASRLKDGKWRVFDKSSGLPDDSVYDFFETTSKDGSRVLWIATLGGIAKFENDKLTKFDKSSGLPSNEVICLSEGISQSGSQILWAGTAGGLARFEDGKWSAYDSKSGLPDDRVQSILETAGENGSRILWAGTTRGLARFADGKWTVFDKSSGLPDNAVSRRSLVESISQNGTRTLWVGTPGGLARFEQGKWTVYTAESGLPNNSINFLKEIVSPDGLRTLWICTNGGGLARLEYDKWVSIDSASGLPDNLVFNMLESVSAAGAQTFWFCTNGGLARFEQGKWTVYTAESGLRSNILNMVLETVSVDGSPTIWVATYGGGLARLEKGKWTVFDAESGLSDNYVTCLLERTEEDGKRVLWVGTYNGLSKLKDGKVTVVDAKSGFPNASVFSLLETVSSDGTRTFWAGTFSGLARLDKDNWTFFDAKSGLPNSFVLGLRQTQTPEGKRYLWAATADGAARLDLDAKNPSWFVITNKTKPALPDKIVYRIEEDSKHRIYIFTDKGIARLTARTPTSDDPSEYSIYTFKTEDGLPSNGCNQNGSMVDSLGRIWAGTLKGAAVFDPSKEIEDHTPKPLYIERTLLGGVERAIANESLSYKENNVTFEFALLSLFRQKDTRFQTQLLGFDDKPSEWTDKPERIYTNLPEGSYTFKVWGIDYAGNVSGPAEIAFKVRPAPWRTWQAYLFYFAALVGIGHSSQRWRLRSLERRNLELEEKVKERTSELARQNQELIESHKRADRIFSAFTQALPGTVLDGKYQIDKKIGSGGFGAVYRATHLTLQRPVAVKIFKPLPGNDSAEALERFRLEAVSACRINHPNAVAVLDSGISSEGIAYLVMELLEGHSLAQELRVRGKLSLGRAAQILIPVCEVLSKAHSAGIIHRDIKPQNIFLSRDEKGESVKVVDFGIAKLVGEEWGSAAQSLTGTGVIIGTPVYMAPERLASKMYDGKSDVYSLGVLLYEMLCGQVPFYSDEGPWQTALMHLMMEPVAPRRIDPELPEEVERVILRALSKDPHNRPDTMELKVEFLKAVDLDPQLDSYGNLKAAIEEKFGIENETIEIEETEQIEQTTKKMVSTTDEQWRRIEEIFNAALERKPEERDMYLDEACAGDEDLRKEIDSLLSAQKKAERSDFLSPAVEKMDKG